MQRSLVGSRVKSMLRFLLVLLSGILFVSMSVHAQGPAQDITCEDGSGEYSDQFSTGVGIVVGPMRKGPFAERSCAATLAWKGQEITVASDAGQVNIDVLGGTLVSASRLWRFRSMTLVPVPIATIRFTRWRNHLIYSLPSPVEITTALPVPIWMDISKSGRTMQQP